MNVARFQGGNGLVPRVTTNIHQDFARYQRIDNVKSTIRLLVLLLLNEIQGRNGIEKECLVENSRDPCPGSRHAFIPFQGQLYGSDSRSAAKFGHPNPNLDGVRDHSPPSLTPLPHRTTEVAEYL